MLKAPFCFKLDGITYKKQATLFCVEKFACFHIFLSLILTDIWKNFLVQNLTYFLGEIKTVRREDNYTRQQSGMDYPKYQ